MLLFQTCGAVFFSDLDVDACIFQENGPRETFSISFESTQNKQQHGTTITDIEEEKVMVLRNVRQLFSECFVVLTSSSPLSSTCWNIHSGC